MESVAITDIGKQREINQDYVYRADDPIGILPNLYIVADGMGGHKAGDLASRFCVDEFKKETGAMTGRTILGCLEGAIRHTNEELLKLAATSPDYEGMGTTFVAVTVEGASAYTVNVGDSRMYHICGNRISQITKDHSLVEEMIRNGELDRKDAKHHPKKNVITRALGAAQEVVPDFFEVPVTEGDYLLLCSDGLTNMIEDGEILETLTDHVRTLQEKAERLVASANEQGGKDNISVVLIRI